MHRIAIACAALSVSACSTILEGRTQDIAINTNPQGAACTMQREGVQIGAVAKTPGSAVIEKNKHDITVTCTKDGFQQTSKLDHSDVAAAAFGNILAGGIVGVIVDSSTGAADKYDSTVNVVLVPVDAAAAAPASPTAEVPKDQYAKVPTS